MIPAIYKIRNNGQFVNDACQYIVEHRKLAINICIIPMLFFAFLEFVNIFFIHTLWISFSLCLLASIFTFIAPSMFMYVTEHSEEFGYPEHTPKIYELRELFFPYISKTILILVIGGIATILGTFVLVGIIFFPFITSLALVKYQRNNEYVSFEYNQVYTDDNLSISDIFKMIFDEFGNFALLILGSYIITFSMMFGPLLMISLSFLLFDSFISPELRKFIFDCMGDNGTIEFYLALMTIGAVLANMISIVIMHFFYGHCQTKIAKELTF